MASGSCVTLLPLCSTPKVATREGQTSAFAYQNNIGVGIWYASGAQVNTAVASGPQDLSLIYTGTTKPDTYSKGFSCNVPAACPA